MRSISTLEMGIPMTMVHKVIMIVSRMGQESKRMGKSSLSFHTRSYGIAQ
jgi:hypothetical protein